jgi:hypothetical protein
VLVFETKNPLSGNLKFSTNTTTCTKPSDLIEAVDIAAVVALTDW